MSIASPPPKTASPPDIASARSGSDELIESRIAEACRALWWAEVVRTVLRMVVALILALLIWVVMDQWVYSPGRPIRLIAFVTLLASLGSYSYRRLRPLLSGSINIDYAARSLERDMPELRHALTSYVTLRADREVGDLRSRVVRSIGSTTAKQLRGHDALPIEATGTMRWWVATALALALLVGYSAFSPKNTLQSAARLAAPIASIDSPRRVSIRDVEPGNTDAIAGRSVDVSASISGLRNGEEVVCTWELPSGRQELILQEDAQLRRHVGQLPLPHSASGIVRYSLAAGDATAGPFQLQVQDVPVVALESVHYTPPQYTGQSPYTSSSGAITAVDGTTVKILASTNRAITKAKIEFNPRTLGDRIQATAGASDMNIDQDGTSISLSFPVRSARGRSAAVELEDYRILVWDASGQGNPDPIQYPIRIVPDLPPEVAITVPASSPKELPIDAQQIIEVHASDPDFGLKSISLEIRAGIDMIDQPVLWSSESGEKGHLVAEFPLRPAELNLRIGDTVQVVAVAADNRASDVYPDVEPNVVRTDPVTLKITASGNVPEENDPNADGLSSPDQRSAESDSGGKESSGDGNQQQAGGGGSGTGSQQQPGGGQGQEGSGGQGSGQESSDDSSGQGGGSSPDGTDDGNPSASASPSAQSDASDATDNNQSTGPSENGSASSDASTQQPDATPGQEGGQENQDNQTGGDAPGDSGENQAGTQTDPGSAASRQPGSGDREQPVGDGQSSGADNSGTGAGDTSTGQPRSPNQQAGSGSSDSGSESEQPSEAPKHDGEAFERIQEFLEKNRGQGSSSSEAGNQNQGEQSSAAGQQRNDTGDDRSTDGSSGQEQTRSPSANDRDGQSGTSTGDQSSQTDPGQRDQAAQQTDQQQDSSSASGDSQAGAQGSQQAPTSDQDGDNSDAGEQQPTSTGDQGAGSRSGQSAQSGQPQDSAQSPEQSASPDQQDGDQPSGAEPSGDGQTSKGTGSTESPAQETSGDRSPRDGQSQSGSASETGNQNRSPQTEQDSQPNTSAQASSGGAGEGGDQGDLDDQPAVPPDPVNLEYAKKATDLVLDYLNQTRESPDPELLEDLQWTPEDLKQFADRWRQIREMAQQPGPQGNREMEEALKSLGLRPKDGAASTTREAGDQLGTIRDTGNRQPPPPAFRDAFDAFRRAVGGGK